MQWNLHLTGEALETELEDALQKLVVELEGIGHRLTSATLTTDTGQRSLETTPPAEDAPVEPADDSVPSDSSTSDSSPEVSTDTPPSL